MTIPLEWLQTLLNMHHHLPISLIIAVAMMVSDGADLHVVLVTEREQPGIRLLKLWQLHQLSQTSLEQEM